jgi:translation elongation factor EF-G
MDYLRKWAEDVIERAPFIFSGKFHVKGEHKRHHGGHLEYAAIEAVVESSDKFEVVFGNSVLNLKSDSINLVNVAIMGMLDILSVAKTHPVFSVRIELLSADIHPIDSNEIAFRMAGRDAATSFLEKLASHSEKI